MCKKIWIEPKDGELARISCEVSVIGNVGMVGAMRAEETRDGCDIVEGMEVVIKVVLATRVMPENDTMLDSSSEEEDESVLEVMEN